MNMVMESNAGEQLVSELSRAIFDLLPGIDVGKVKSTLSSVVSKYFVRPLKHDEENVDIDDKIKTYLAAMKIEGLAKSTLYNYELDLKLLARDIRKNVADITPPDIRAHLATFDHLKMSTLDTKISRIKSFFGWLALEELITKDPTKKIKPPKQESTLPKTVTIDELELLRESCKTVRQRAFLEVFYATGARLSEVQNLNIEDIDWMNNCTKVFGKGKKEREVYFNFKAIHYLKRYLSERTDDCPALFVTMRRPYRRLSNKGIQREFGKIAEQARLEKRVTPHTMRRTFATLTLNNGAELVAVQELLGHKSPETTMRYARITEERKREQHKRYLVL